MNKREAKMIFGSMSKSQEELEMLGEAIKVFAKQKPLTHEERYEISQKNIQKDKEYFSKRSEEENKRIVELEEKRQKDSLYQEIKSFLDNRKYILRFPTSGKNCSSCKYFELDKGKNVHGTCLKKHRSARKTDLCWCHPTNYNVCRCCEKKGRTIKYQSKNLTSFLCEECIGLFEDQKRKLEELKTRRDEVCSSCPENKEEFGCIKSCILKIYKI